MKGLFWGVLLLEFFINGFLEIAVRHVAEWKFAKKLGLKAPAYRPALNIEHTTERQGLFVILAL
jgi:hypothetical protein